VGVDHDTAAFAVESIRRWWRWMGSPAYPKAKRLLITADSGGSNGARVRLWKWAAASRRNRTANLGLPLSTGNQQVEQNRTLFVLFHQPELARQAAD
jgi:Rhodopirellula transposase DDE domain